MREAIEYKDSKKTDYFFVEEYTEKEVKRIKKVLLGTWSNVIKNPSGSISISFKENMDIYFELEIGDIIEVCSGGANLHRKGSHTNAMIRKKFKDTDLLIEGCLVEKCNDSEDHLIKFDTINRCVSGYVWSLTGFTCYLKNFKSSPSFILCPGIEYGIIEQFSVWYLSNGQLIPSIEYNLEREKKMKKEKDLPCGDTTQTKLEVLFEFYRLQRELHDYRDNSSEGPLPLLFTKIAIVGYAANVNSSPWFAPQTEEYETRQSRAMRAIIDLQNEKTDDFINDTSLGKLLRHNHEKQPNISEEGMVSDIKEGFLYLTHLLGNEETSEEFWNEIINSGFEYEKEELKRRARLFIDSLNA